MSGEAVYQGEWSADMTFGTTQPQPIIFILPPQAEPNYAKTIETLAQSYQAQKQEFAPSGWSFYTFTLQPNIP
jgi:hypothetical protein